MKELRKDAEAIFRTALEAVDPYRCVSSFLEGMDLPGRTFLVGMGKASVQMAKAAEDILGDRVEGGLVVTKYGHGGELRRIKVLEAGHPVPDEAGMRAAEEILSVARKTGQRGTLLCLISGGGSALLTLPAAGITLEDLMRTNELLLRSGANIQELNTVRKHLSRVKGGQLARLAAPARVLSLILSDVPGDPLDAIASGPTAPDPTSFQDAARILRRYGLWDKVPPGVRAHIEAGVRGEINETPKPGDPVFELVQNVIVGSGRTAAEAAAREGARLGYRTLILTTTLEGEAREVAKVLAALARELVRFRRPLPPPALVIAAGETTVTVRGNGSGGRNQELALAAAPGIQGLAGVALMSLGTDGRDGPTDAAGGLVDGDTITRLKAAGVELEEALAKNDSYHALKASEDLIVTGPTGTNVADLVLLGVRKEAG